MAQIIIEIPDAQAPRVVDAFAATYNWSADLGITKVQFAKRQVAQFIKTVFKTYEAKIAAEAASTASLAETEQINIE